MAKKDMLFFKKSCQYCQEVLAAISGSSVSVFVLVDIDKMSTRLPPFVKQVPLIFTTNQKILVGDAVMAHTKLCIKTIQKSEASQDPSVKKPQQIQQQQVVQEPASYVFGDQNFGMVQSNDSPGTEFSGNRFDTIIQNDDTSVPNKQGGGRAPKIAPDVYEAFLAQRRAETPVSGMR